MTVLSSGRDALLEIARGTFPNISHVNVYGRATDVDIAQPSDLWDRANSVDSDDIITLPTAGRNHDIASSSASDTNGGVGANQVQVFGLETNFSTVESSELINLNGVANVTTVARYVALNRLEVTAKGATDVNVGTITATAQTDATVSLQINPSEGETHTALYSFAGSQTGFITNLWANVHSPSAAVVTVSLLVNTLPTDDEISFTTKASITAKGGGEMPNPLVFIPYLKIDGPAIVKLQATTDTDDTDVSGGFDMIVVDD